VGSRLGNYRMTDRERTWHVSSCGLQHSPWNCERVPMWKLALEPHKTKKIYTDHLSLNKPLSPGVATLVWRILIHWKIHKQLHVRVKAINLTDFHDNHDSVLSHFHFSMKLHLCRKCGRTSTSMAPCLCTEDILLNLCSVCSERFVKVGAAMDEDLLDQSDLEWRIMHFREICGNSI
jgi:hypothetical protein